MKMKMFRSRQLAAVKELKAEDWAEVATLYRGFQEAVEGIVRRARLRDRSGN